MGSEFEQRENNVKSSWAPWPCPKKGPWPAPPLCGEGGGEMQDLVSQSADVQKEDNVKLSWAPWPCPKKAHGQRRRFVAKDASRSNTMLTRVNLSRGRTTRICLGCKRSNWAKHALKLSWF